jgi:4-alpha-glucanotransferase
MKKLKRSSGILMPMSSLPSNYGIGSLGKCAYEFVDFLKAAGQKYWQLLPMGPTSLGDSPYSSFSTFAGNPYFVDLDMLVEDGLLEESELKSIKWGSNQQRVDYGAIYNNRFKVLHKAYERGWQRYGAELGDFRRENGGWLENYALYMSLKAHFDMKCWVDWPDESIRMHRPEAVEKYRRELESSVNFYVFIQFLFYRQWKKLRAYAKEQGISFIGDIPIYVALDSADVWSEPQYFQLDGRNVPTEVSGVPPDAFTDDGQLWGNPLYDWDAMAADGYGWWIRRIDGAKKLYDVIRIDHFRGMESYWAVPAGETTAKNGHWRQGPGMKLVGVLSSWFNDLSFIAEDLGFITPEVKQLLEDSGFPGMKVLEFAFDAQGESDYLPHNCQSNSVCYIGTHDNDTVLGWLESSKPEDVKFAKDYMHITDDEGWCWGLIRSGMATASKLFVVQMQDVLELPTSCRMNTPGVAWGNWQWRMKPDAITPELIEKLRGYTERYRRI